MTLPAEAPHVLLIDQDRDLADVVEAILVDEGYRVSVLVAATEEAVRVAVGRLEPDAILPDGAGAAGARDGELETLLRQPDRGGLSADDAHALVARLPR